MKRILVTGGAGSIGINVIKFLLSEGKYEVTALDLKNKRTIKRLKKYRRKINIIYGDVNDSVLMEALVKTHDVIIHLASVMPPLGEFTNASLIVDYNGTENIIKAINYYNKDCFLMYASTTSVYGSNPSKVKDKIDLNNLTNYSKNKYDTEILIKKKLSNYTIFRIPLVLNNLKSEPFMYNICKRSEVEITTNFDVAYAFVAGIKHKKEINKKIFNVGMGDKGRMQYNEILKLILENYGVSFRYILSRIFLEKNYYSPILKDSDELENIIHYQSDTIYNYQKRLKRKGKNRRISYVLTRPILYFKK